MTLSCPLEHCKKPFESVDKLSVHFSQVHPDSAYIYLAELIERIEQRIKELEAKAERKYKHSSIFEIGFRLDELKALLNNKDENKK